MDVNMMLDLYAYEALPVKINAGSVIGTIIIASLGAFATFKILSRLQNEECLDATSRKAFLALLASLCLVLGSWTSHMIGLHVLLMPAPLESWFLTFKPGFVVLSLFVPLIVISITFVMISIRIANDMSLWLYALAGGFVGLSLGFMHYSVFFSLPFLTLDYTLLQTLLALILGIVITTSSSLCLAMFRTRRNRNKMAKYILPLLFGCGMCGMNFLALSGMSFHVKMDVTVEQLRAGQHEWMMVTMAIPVIIAFVLASVIATISTVNAAKERWQEKRTRPQIILASISLTNDGRVLTSEDGCPPFQLVNLDGLSIEALPDINPGAGTFNWFYSLSFNWGVLFPFLERILQDSSASNCVSTAVFQKKVLSCLKQDSISDFEPTNDILKCRLLEALATLAKRLNIAVTEMGYLYDQVLRTGVNMIHTEFLSLEDDAPTCPDFEKGIPGVSSFRPEGIVLFLVRRFPQAESLHGDEWALNYVPNDFRLSFLLDLRNALADTTGSTLEDTDRILIGCQDYVENGTKPVVQPGGTYVSLHATRIASDGYQEVLVYDFAKHQIPSYKLGLPRFTHDMRGWIRSAAHLTPNEVLEVCRNDLAREQELLRLSMLANRTSLESERYTINSLLDFQESFAEALKMLLTCFPSLPNLCQIAKLSSQVLDMPTAGALAHLIVFKVDISDLSVNGIDFAGRGSKAGDHHSIMSSGFVYTPQTLFDNAQSIISNKTSKFYEQLKEDLNRLYPSIPHISHPEDCHIYSNDIGLVSTFSFDSESDADRRTSLRKKMSFSSLRSWASSSAHNRRRRSRTPAPPMPSMHPILESTNTEYHPLASTSRPSESSRGERTWEQPLYRNNRNPYLHLQLPPPLVFPHHPYSTNKSNASLDSLDDLYNGGDTMVITNAYTLNNRMERADAWSSRL